MKKVITIMMAAFLLIAFSVTSFAAEDTPDLRSVFTDETVDFNISVSKITNPVEPQAWPGSGAAAQVSSVIIEQIGYLNVAGREGNVGILVKVTGHGRDYAKYDNVSVDYFQRDGFILSGTLVDGWYYLYDCGAPTLGRHRFDIRCVSHNSPYTEKSAWATFDITP